MATTVHATGHKHLKRLIDKVIEAQGPLCSLNHIDVSSITTFANMFKGTDFNGDILGWNTGQGVRFHGMFEDCPFNGDISQWDVSKAVNMSRMFRASGFNGDLSKWNVSELSMAEEMFADSQFEGNLCAWRPMLQFAASMFSNSRLNCDVSAWTSQGILEARRMFCTPTFQHGMSSWILDQTADVDFMFHAEYKGSLPSVGIYDPYSCYQAMLGNYNNLVAYLNRQPFGSIHASCLLNAPSTCSWANEELVSRAKELLAIGPSMGLSHEEMGSLLIEHAQANNRPLTNIDTSLFEALSNH